MYILHRLYAICIMYEDKDLVFKLPHTRTVSREKSFSLLTAAKVLP